MLKSRGTTQERLARLVGDGQDKGGGLPLPSVFSCAGNTILDGGAVTTEQVNAALERDLEWKKERVNYVWKGGFPDLTEDVLAQLQWAKVATQGDDNLWRINEGVEMDKLILVIPGRLLKGIIKSQLHWPTGRSRKGHGAWTGFHFKLNPKDVRDQRNKESSRERGLNIWYSQLRSERQFEVQVEARGRTSIKFLRIHPLSMIFPVMEEERFRELAADVLANGFTDPMITLYQGQVLDGSHRVAVSAALHIPIQTWEFPGDEMAALEYVKSRNLHRRQLTQAQITLLVQEIYLPKAKAIAKEQLLEGQLKGAAATKALAQACARALPELRGLQTRHISESWLAQICANQEITNSGLAPIGAKPGTPETKAKKPRKATEIAAEMSMGLVKARTLEHMAPVVNAPRTQQRIKTGELKTNTEARKAALEELGQEEPPKEKDSGYQAASAWRSLGHGLKETRYAIKALQNGGPGKYSRSEYQARMLEFQALLDDVNGLIRDMTQ